MDIATLGLLGVAISVIYDKLKQQAWPSWVNQLSPAVLAAVGALLAPSYLGVPFTVKDAIGAFLVLYGAMQGTYVGGHMISVAAHNVLPDPSSFPKLTAANRQLLIDRYVQFEGLTPEAAAKKVDDLFKSLPGG